MFKHYKEDFTELKKPSENYYHILSIFYSSNSICPNCKKDKLEKERREGKITLLCKKCRWTATVELAKYINLYNEKSVLIEKRIDLLYQLLKIIKEKNGDLDHIKKEYDTLDKRIEEINEVLDAEKDERDQLITDQFKKLHKYSDLYFKKSELFSKIDERIDGKIRERLIESFKKGKYDKSLAKTFKLKEETVKIYFDWLNMIKEYALLMKDVNNTLYKYQKLIKKQDEINRSFLVKIGSVNESKKIAT